MILTKLADWLRKIDRIWDGDDHMYLSKTSLKYWLKTDYLDQKRRQSQ